MQVTAELVGVLIQLAIAAIFAFAEIAVTLYTGSRTSNKIIKHIDQSERKILNRIKGAQHQNGNAE